MADLPTKVPSEIASRFEVNNNTLKEVAKENPKDRIEVEIGDSKVEDFKPQFKLMRWDNEVNFSIRGKEHENAVSELKANEAVYRTPAYATHMKPTPPTEGAEDGGFSFETELTKKPKGNVLDFTLNTKGLVFYYQPPLTQEEIDEGVSRPENVEGSYAVYHESKGGMNRLGGMEYKTGKAFHLYRMQAIDANGNSVWCDFNNDVGDVYELHVTIPQDFLDTATYPVIVR